EERQQPRFHDSPFRGSPFKKRKRLHAYPSIRTGNRPLRVRRVQRIPLCCPGRAASGRASRPVRRRPFRWILLEDPYEGDAGEDERKAGEAARRRGVLAEADPAELVGEDRADGLPGNDGGDERDGAEARRARDDADDVERAEQAADPDPPRRAAELRAGGKRLRGDERDREQEQSDRADEEGDERR